MEEIKTLNQKGIELMIQLEGLRLSPYQDTRGIWTIGIGNTYWPDGRAVKENDYTITKWLAIQNFMKISKHFALTVFSTTRDDITQNQFNALFSFTYNEGPERYKDSHLRWAVNNYRPNGEIYDCFMQYTRAGIKLGALTERRRMEYNTFIRQ